MYDDLREANATTDFPLLLANVMYKKMLDRFKGVNSPWRKYTEQGNLTDFKSHKRVIMGEAPDLKERAEGGQTTGSTLQDYDYDIALKTYDRSFTVTRQAIINDDLNALQKHPERFGRAAGRTIAKSAKGLLEGSFLAYDNTELFRTTVNIGDTALTNDAAGIAALSAGMTVIEKATEPSSGEKMGLEAKYLITCPDLEDTALRLTTAQQFIPVSTGGGTNEIGKAKRLEVLIEPFLDTTTGWWIAAAPADAHFGEIGFLNGKDTPDLLVKKPDMLNLAGGDDQWGSEFNDLTYNVRYDYAVQAAYYQAVYRGKS